MPSLKILIAVDQYLLAEGLRSFVESEPEFIFTSIISEKNDLIKMVKKEVPDILIIDHTSPAFSVQTIKQVVEISPKTGILAINPGQNKEFYIESMKVGVRSFLMKCCDRDEIISAINSTANGEQFYCSKVLDIIVNDENLAPEHEIIKNNRSCEGINISEREEEIIRFIAEGNSNKEIADRLFLSPHTVNTHRKNIMAKLGVNNTAGIVIFAIKNDIISPNKYLFSASPQ